MFLSRLRCGRNRRSLIRFLVIICCLSGLYYGTIVIPEKIKSSETCIAPWFISSILNIPTWYIDHDWGLVENKSFQDIIIVVINAVDGEEKTAWDNFFFGTTSGLILEMGAMDGYQFSVSRFSERYANWRAIMVEGNPILASHITAERAGALSFNAAICDKAREVHYIVDSRGQDGILEFMTDSFVSLFFAQLTTNGTVDPVKVEEDMMKTTGSIVKKVQCIPLSYIFDALQLKHINFFVLDVEGGELNVLKAIDFSKTSFDVIAVETDRGTDTAPATTDYVNSVVDLLTSKGYLLWARRLGRNSWFYSPSFEPFRKSPMKVKLL